MLFMMTAAIKGRFFFTKSCLRTGDLKFRTTLYRVQCIVYVHCAICSKGIIKSMVKSKLELL